MKISLWLAALVMALPLNHAESRPRRARVIKPVTVEWMKQEISRHGAKYVVSQLYAQKRQQEFLGEIEKGEANWIALAPDIAFGTDAGSSEDLTMSLAQALATNPAAVLTIMQDNDADYERLCSIPFVGHSWIDTSRYIDEAEIAVGRVSDSSLQVKKTKCLHTLQKYAQILRKVSRAPSTPED